MPPDEPRRRRLRLPHYDYAQPAAYFITICTNGRRCVLGEMADGVVLPTSLGEDVISVWNALPTRFAHLTLDAFVLMPNHIHGVLLTAPGGPPLPVTVGTFKSLSTRHAPLSLRPLWQRGYYDHVVRDENDMERIRTYIASNPNRWPRDPDNPARPDVADPLDPTAPLP